MRPADRDVAGQARLPAAADAPGRRHADGVLSRRPERGRNFDSGIERAAAPAAGGSGIRLSPRNRAGEPGARASLSPHRPRAGLAAVVLPLEQHPRRRADDPGVAGPAAGAGGARAAGAADDCRSEVGLAHREFHRAVAERPLPAGRRPDREPVSGFRRQPAPGAAPRDGAVLRQHRPRGPQRAGSADGRLHVRQRTARQALRDSERVRAAVPARDARAGSRHAPRPARQGRAADGRRRSRPARRRCRAASGSCRRSSA